jgi:hypothetical protein
VTLHSLPLLLPSQDVDFVGLDVLLSLLLAHPVKAMVLIGDAVQLWAPWRRAHPVHDLIPTR